MQIKLYQVNGIDDYFFYKINPSYNEINEIKKNYPTGIKEIKKINLNYEYYDTFIKETLEPKLLKFVANNIFFKAESINRFMEVINEFQKTILDLESFLLEQINSKSDKYISDVFSHNLKLKQEVVLDMNKYYDKNLNYFKFKKEHLNDCLALKILDKNDKYSLFVNFNKESYIQKT